MMEQETIPDLSEVEKVAQALFVLTGLEWRVDEGQQIRAYGYIEDYLAEEMTWLQREKYARILMRPFKSVHGDQLFTLQPDMYKPDAILLAAQKKIDELGDEEAVALHWENKHRQNTSAELTTRLEMCEMLGQRVPGTKWHDGLHPGERTEEQIFEEVLHSVPARLTPQEVSAAKAAFNAAGLNYNVHQTEAGETYFRIGDFRARVFSRMQTQVEQQGGVSVPLRCAEVSYQGDLRSPNGQGRTGGG